MSHRSIPGAFATLLIASAPTFGVVLYDGSLNTTPNAQGWLAYGDADLFNDYASTSGGQTQLDTLSANSVQAGFSNHTIFGTIVNPAFPTLDRTTGFALSFTARVLTEHHDSVDRAGFSVIALGSDKKGIELAFPGGEVFAQNGGTSPNLFTKGESAALDSSTGYVSYDLIVGASSYQLKANGTPILSGAIRDYSAFVPPFGPDPYELANYLFLGDNTTSARADTSITYVGVTVPEPTSMVLGCVAGLLLVRRRR